jgi:hypothetical protein
MAQLRDFSAALAVLNLLSFQSVRLHGTNSPGNMLLHQVTLQKRVIDKPHVASVIKQLVCSPLYYRRRLYSRYGQVRSITDAAILGVLAPAAASARAGQLPGPAQASAAEMEWITREEEGRCEPGRPIPATDQRRNDSQSTLHANKQRAPWRASLWCNVGTTINTITIADSSTDKQASASIGTNVGAR